MSWVCSEWLAVMTASNSMSWTALCKVVLCRY
jgi:hypothetical protein